MSSSTFPPPPPLDPLSSLLLQQTFSLTSFCRDFLSHESDHRDWSNTIGPIAGGVPSFPLPLAQLLRTPQRLNLFLIPYLTIPFRLPLTLSPSHGLLLSADFPASGDLAHTIDGLTDSARILSLVTGDEGGGGGGGVGVGGGWGGGYRQWLGVSKYGGHGGVHLTLRPRSLASLHPALSSVVPSLSVSSTAATHHDHLHLSHSSLRLHVRPFAGAGDRGVVAAEGIYSHYVGEEGVNARLMYTHRISERPMVRMEQVGRAVRGAFDQVVKVTTSPEVERAQAELTGRPGLFQSLSSYVSQLKTNTPSPLPTLPPSPFLSQLTSPPSPSPFLAWPYPAYLSLGAAYFFSLSSHPQPYRLLDSPHSHLLRPLSLALGLSVEASQTVQLQVEGRLDDERLSGDATVHWRRSSVRRGWGEELHWYVAVGAAVDRKDPAQSHAHASIGLTVNW